MRIQSSRVVELLTIVNHLHVVTGASFADPVAAGLAVDLGRSLLENFLDCRPSGSRTTGHKGGTMSGTFLSSGNTRTNKEQAFGLEFLGASDGIGIVRVSTVDNNVTRLEMGHKLLDEVIDCLTGLDEKNNFSGTLQLGDELLDGVSTLDFGSCSADKICEIGDIRSRHRPFASLARKWSTLLVVRL